MRVLGIPGALWNRGRQIEDILSLQAKTREALEKIDERMSGLEERLIRLEANEGRLITEAKAAAGAASTAVATALLSDTVRD